jgi:4'-phosphopantetheinyl transferase
VTPSFRAESLDLLQAAPRAGTVQVCAAALPAAALPDAFALLSPDELERAERFIAPVHKHAFIGARAFLRRVLARATGIDPRHLVFESGTCGKPRLRRAADEPPIEFSFSRRTGFALVGIAADGPIGVDVEVVRPVDDLENVARRFFAPAEFRAIADTPAPARLRAFFDCWTRKEAVVKALGVGLSMPLDSFEVAFGAGVAPALTRMDRAPVPAAAWSLLHFEPRADVIGALAAPFAVRHVDAVMLSNE